MYLKMWQTEIVLLQKKRSLVEHHGVYAETNAAAGVWAAQWNPPAVAGAHINGFVGEVGNEVIFPT